MLDNKNFRLPTVHFRSGHFRNSPFRVTAVLVAMLLALWCNRSALAGPPGAPGDLFVGSDSFTVQQHDAVTGALDDVFVVSANLNGPRGLAWGPNGNLFVASEFNNRILEFDGQTGDFVGVFADGGGLNSPWGIAFGPNGNLFVASLFGSEVLEYDGDNGGFVGVFASGGGLALPIGLTFGPDGNLFVTSAFGQVIEFDGVDGSLVGTFTSGLSDPRGLVFGPDGDLYVCSAGGDEVRLFDGTNGASLGVFASGGGLSDPQGLSFSPDGASLLVVSGGTDEIIEYDGVTGALIGTFVSGLTNPTFLAFKTCPGGCPNPVVNDISITQSDNCGIVTGMVITGSGLVPYASVTLARAGENDIVGTLTASTIDTSLTYDFNLTDVATGLWDLELTYPDGPSAIVVDAIEVIGCAPLSVTGVDPQQVTNCGMDIGGTSFTINGTGLKPGINLLLSLDGQPDIVGSDVDIQSSTLLTASIDLAGAEPGLWDLSVTSADQQESSTLTAAVEVVGCPPMVDMLIPTVASNCAGAFHLRVLGTDLTQQTTVTIRRAGEPDITPFFSQWDVGTSGDVQGWYDMSAAVTGTWDVVVETPNADPAILPNAITVKSCGGVGDLFVAVEDEGILHFDGTTGEPLGVFAGGPENNDIRDFDFGGPNGNLFVSYRSPLNSAFLVGEFDRELGELRRDIWRMLDVGFAVDGLVFAPGPNGRLFGINNAPENVVAFDPGGTALPQEFVADGSGGLNNPTSITIGPNGNLFVTSTSTYGDAGAVDGVLEFDGQTGVFVGVFVDGGDPTNWQDPKDLVFHPTTGSLLVADGAIIRRYDGDTGLPLPHLVPFASGGLSRARSLTFGPNGNLFVLDTGADRVREYDGDTGAYLGDFVSQGLEDTTGVTLAFRHNIAPFPTPQLFFATPVNPFVADNCGWLTISIDGAGLVPGAAVQLVRAGEADIVGQLNNFGGDVQATVRFYVGGATPGPWDLVWSNPDDQSATLSSAIDIAPCSAPAVFGASFQSQVLETCAPLYSAEIFGDRLVEGTEVKLVKAGSPVIPGRIIRQFSPRHCCGFAPTDSLTADFHITGAPGGIYDLVVTNPQGQSTTLTNAVTLSLCSLEYSFYDLVPRPGINKQALRLDLNNAGEVVGIITTDDGRIELSFLWSNGVLVDLLDAASCGGPFFPVAISDDGLMVGRDEFGRLSICDGGTITTIAPVEQCDDQSHLYSRVSPDARFAGGRIDRCPVNRRPLFLDIENDAALSIFPPGVPFSENGETVAVNSSGLAAIQLIGETGQRVFLYDHLLDDFSEITNPLGGGTEVWDINEYGVAVLALADAVNPGRDAFGYLDDYYYAIEPGLYYNLNAHADAIGLNVIALQTRLTLYSGGTVRDLTEIYEALAPDLLLRLDRDDTKINNDGWILSFSQGGASWDPPALKSLHPWLLIPNLKGDFDDSHDVDGDDIQMFVNVLLNPFAFDFGFQVRADMNDDGFVDFADVPQFIDALMDRPDPVGACCLPDGDCKTAVSERLCVNLQGAFVGDNSDCPCAIGACCLPEGGCAAATELECQVTLGGQFNGDDTECASVSCPVGACCFFTSGECRDIPLFACTGDGGSYLGDGTTCEVIECPEPCGEPFACDIDEGEPRLPCGPGLGDSTNGGCNFNPMLFIPITCGQSVCGGAWADGNWRDTDWYELTLTEASSVTWTVEAEFAALSFIASPPCGSGRFWGIATSDLCGSTSLTVDLPAGSHYMFVSPDEFDGLSCGASPFEYRAEVTCTPLPAGACCLPDGTCMEMAGVECVLLDGFYQGDASTCAGVSCPLAGACCYDSIICVETAEFACAGAYQGDGTTCGSVGCPSCVTCPPGATAENEPCNDTAADTTNGGCNSVPPVYSPIACGDTICGEVWANDGGRDTDWYELVLTERRQVFWTCWADFEAAIFIIDGSRGCDSALTVDSVGTDTPCSPLTLTAILDPGTYWFVVVPTTFSGLRCSTGPHSYVASLNCGSSIPGGGGGRSAPLRPTGLDAITDTREAPTRAPFWSASEKRDAVKQE